MEFQKLELGSSAVHAVTVGHRASPNSTAKGNKTRTAAIQAQRKTFPVIKAKTKFRRKKIMRENRE